MSNPARAIHHFPNSQTQCHSKCKEEDDIIWRRQSGAYKAVYKRLLVSKKTAADLHTYLNDRVRRLRALFDLTESDVAFGAEETGSVPTFHKRIVIETPLFVYKEVTLVIVQNPESGDLFSRAAD